MSRVEKRRSDGSLPVAIDGAFATPPQSGLTWFCFLFPLIEPDRRISRIRLSEKSSRFRPRKAACPSSKFDKAQHLMYMVKNSTRDNIGIAQRGVVK